MKNKKVLLILISIIIILGLVGYFISTKINQKKEQEKITEYIPEEEITVEQLRQTTVSLYFKQKDTNILVPEARKIDVKELTKTPYETLMKLLLEGPKNEKLEKAIPEGTKLNKIELKSGTLYIDLSKEFIENHKGTIEEETLTIYSIVNTLTGLNEVDAVKIQIEGKEDASFKDNAIKLKDPFVKKD